MGKVRKKLPKKLVKDFYIIKLPEIKEDQEEGLLSTEEAAKKEEADEVIVAMVGEECSLKVGDDLLLPAGGVNMIAGSFRLENKDVMGGYDYYWVLRERDVIAIW